MTRSDLVGMSTATKAKPKSKIHPLEDRVVILSDEEAEPYGAGWTSRIPQGLAVGPGRIEKGQRVKMDVQAGDKVIYGKYSGTPYQVGDDELIIIKASDILAEIG